MGISTDKSWRLDPKKPWKVPRYDYQEYGFDGREFFWDVQEFVVENFAWLWVLNLLVAFLLSQLLRPFLPEVNPIIPLWLVFTTLSVVVAFIYGTPTPTRGERLDYRRKREEARRET